MIEVRKSDARGHVNMDWLDSFHTFSFGRYQDPSFMGFGALRVINEDRVQGGKGFLPHGHRNMEIISYVVEGALAHKDSTGSGGTIRPGDVQVMSAGSGIRHSEMNGSDEESVHLLQIWIRPSQYETEPAYAERHFERRDGVTLLVSHDAREGSLKMGQDVDLYRVILPSNGDGAVSLRHRRSWVQVVRGSVKVNGVLLEAGDGAAITEMSRVDLESLEGVEALVFDLV